jgi:hypothetical protein
MKTTLKTVFSLCSAGFILLLSSSYPSVAQTTSTDEKPEEKPMSKAAMKILCERFPLNSRCTAQGGAAPASPTEPSSGSMTGTTESKDPAAPTDPAAPAAPTDPAAPAAPTDPAAPAAPTDPAAPAGGGTTEPSTAPTEPTAPAGGGAMTPSAPTTETPAAPAPTTPK